MSHPVSDESLKRFAMRTASPEESRSIVAHLLKGCPSCAKRLRSLERPAIPAGAYDAMFSRLARVSLGSTQAQASPENSRELLAELDSQTESRQEILVRNRRRYWSPELAELLRNRSHSLRFEDPRKMLHSARLGVLITERLEAKGSDEEARLADLRALCFAQVGTALRVAGDLASADQFLKTARDHRNRGTGAPEVRAVIYEHFASLKAAQYQFTEAERLYAMAAEIWRDLGKPQILARALVGQATAAIYGNDPELALSLLQEALPRIDGEPRLTLAACHAVVRCQIDLGKIEDASLRWIELRPLYERLGDSLLRTRGKRLEGILMIAQGLVPVGLKLLQSAREEFTQKGLEYDAALTGLDMANGYFQLSRWSDLRRILAEILPVLQDRKVERPALAALVGLQRVAADAVSSNR